MSGRISTETFFRPAEMEREELFIPAPLFNRCRLLVTRCKSGHVFVPIRSMQYQAVMDREEIIFVDNHGGYAHYQGEGGRLIELAWRFQRLGDRETLDGPVPVALVSYSPKSREIHRRLMSEFPAALDRLEEKHRKSGCEPKRKNIVPFPSTSN